MDGHIFDEAEFFRALSQSGARVLLIGRRAMIALGVPVMTTDYDLWVHADDAASLNAAVADLGLVPNRRPEDARGFGRYVLENSEHVDVLVARSVGTIEGGRVAFEDLWARRRTVVMEAGVEIAVPEIDDLIETKKFAARAKDVEDIRLLELLKAEEESP
jgi:hypothetical protein